MNERIRELAEQAKAFVVDPIHAKIGGVGEVSFSKYSDLEKFAELIVLECVNAVMDGTKEGDHFAMRIEQHFDNGQGGILHFGVEE